jgi:uncharacterized protein (UPF0216 family)
VALLEIKNLHVALEDGTEIVKLRQELESLSNLAVSLEEKTK